MPRRLFIVPPTKRPLGAAKWFDLALRLAEHPSEGRSLRGSERQPLAPLRVPEIAPTARQAKVVAVVLDELDRYLAGLRLRRARLTADRIHLLSEAAFRRETSNPNFGAFYHAGHVYLRASRCRRTHQLVAMLAHEVAHAVAFNAVIFEGRNGKYWGQMNGLKAVPFLNGFPMGSFEALNEMVTEIMAMELRLDLIARLGMRGRSAKYVANHWYADFALGDFLPGVMCLLIDEFEQLPRLKRLLIRDYLTGGGSFLKLIERRGLTDALAKFELNVESAEAFLVKVSHLLR